jgi:putative ABC transport system ATP-binding protein
MGTAGRLAVPVLIQQAIDKGFVDGAVDMGRITSLCAIGVVVITIGSIAMWGAIVRLAVRAEEALYALRVRVFDHILGLDLADHEEERRGSLVARVTSDIETLSQFFSWGGIAWLLDGTMIVVTGVLMLIYDWRLALIAFFAAAPLVLLLRVVQRHLVSAYSDVRERNAGLLTSVSELVTGSAVIRAYRLGPRTTVEARTSIDRHRNSSIRAGTIAAFLFPSGELFSVLTIAAVLIAGTAMGPGAGLTTGAMVGFIFLCYRFLEPVAEFTEILDQTQTAVAGWRRVLGILERPITITDPDGGRELPRQAPSIELDDVTFRYRARPGQADEDNKPALRDVSFAIEPGTAVAVVGATGSGKTTLARLLTRLADPERGTVRIAGNDLRDVSMASLRRSLLMVPQEPFLFDASIADNVRFGRPAATDDDVALAFVELGLEEWITSLADGLETKVGERGDALSAGERQLVALARAYVANPPCLVLDEATSSVDALTETRLAKALASLARGRTSITIAHRLSTAARAQWILVFDRGRLVEQGSHDDLLAADGVYASLYASWLDATAAADTVPVPLG